MVRGYRIWLDRISTSYGTQPGAEVKRIVLTIQFLCISLALISVLAACEISPAISPPGSMTAPISKPSPISPALKYPADISGQVTIPDLLRQRNLPDRRAGTNQVFWLVDISVKNNSYQSAITSKYEDWVIAIGDKTYQVERGLIQLLNLRDKTAFDDTNISAGQSGSTTICFSVPQGVNPADAQIAYQGQNPYSYGRLTGGDKVAVYDWDLKTAISSQQTATQVAGGMASFYIPSPIDYSVRTVELKVVKQFHGQGPTVIRYTPDKWPWAINAYYTPTSKLATSFDVVVVPTEAIQKAGLSQTARTMLSWYLVGVADNTIGSLIKTDRLYPLDWTLPVDIDVRATGCNWTITIGTE